MKLRVRSVATRETLRITVRDDSSLLDLKTLISSSLSSGDEPPIAPQSIHLSLNRTDELLARNPSDRLACLGLTSGDLLFFSFSPFQQTLMNTEAPQNQNLPANPSPSTGSDPNVLNKKTDSDPMEIDSEPVVAQKSGTNELIPDFLKRVMNLETNQDTGVLCRLITMTHAAFLDLGFVNCNGLGLNLPPNWTSQVPNLSLHYTIPEFLDQVHGSNDKSVVLKLSLLSNFVTIYGYLGKTHLDFYRACFNMSKIAILLSSDMSSPICEKDQKEIVEIFRVLKDTLCLPLMIDITLVNGLPLPPCFTRLPTDVKSKILDLLPGADAARAGATCSEMRNLSSDEQLWKDKFERELKSYAADASVMSVPMWRKRFRRAWVKKSNAIKASNRRNLRYLPQLRPGFLLNPTGPHRFPMIGGDFDRFPVIGDVSMVGPVARRQFSPPCNLGGNRGRF